MARKATSTDLDNAVKAYQAGTNICAAAKLGHTSYETLRKILKAKGLLRTSIESRRIQAEKVSATRRAANPMPRDVVDMYEAGKSENAIAEHFGTSRSVVRAWLLDTPAKVRGRLEASRLRASQMTDKEKKVIMKAAQEATRGIPLSKDHKEKIAKTREKNKTSMSETEILLFSWLDNNLLVRYNDVDLVPQKAIGPYNADIAVGPVAVEVFGGNWHSSKPGHAKRSRYILNAGWHMVFVWVNARRSPLTAAVADYVVAFANEMSRNPTAIRQYRVIRGDGQELSRGSINDSDISIVVPGYQGGNISS